MSGLAHLPGLHEAQEQQECRNVQAAGMAPELGLLTHRWTDSLRTVRCAALPEHAAANQIMGLKPDDLHDLDRIVAWFDQAGCAAFLRWPGPDVNDAVSARLARLGFLPHELEAWMHAPLDRVVLDAPAHDVREVSSPEDLQDYAQAFVEGWQISHPTTRRVALAALCPWPSPPGWRRYIATVDGQPAGEALLVFFDNLAYLAEAATVPRFRKRGIQRALIRRRLDDARDAGATHVFGAVQYGDASWRNMRGMGLREAFMTLSFKRPARR